MTNNIEIGRIIRNFYQQLYDNKLSYLEEMEAFLETYKLPKLKQEEIDFLNRPINYEEIELVIKNLPKNKSPGPDGFPGEVYKTFKDEIIPILLKLFQKIEIEERKTPQTLSVRPVLPCSQTKQRLPHITDQFP